MVDHAKNPSGWKSTAEKVPSHICLSADLCLLGQFYGSMCLFICSWWIQMELKYGPIVGDVY